MGECTSEIIDRNAFVACSHPHDGQPAALLICEDCGAVAELDAPEAFATLNSKAHAQGFRPVRAVIEMSGHCGHCAEAA